LSVPFQDCSFSLCRGHLRRLQRFFERSPKNQVMSVCLLSCRASSACPDCRADCSGVRKTYILVMSKPLFSAIAHTGQHKLAIEGEEKSQLSDDTQKQGWRNSWGWKGKGWKELPKLDEQVPRLVSLPES